MDDDTRQLINQLCHDLGIDHANLVETIQNNGSDSDSVIAALSYTQEAQLIAKQNAGALQLQTVQANNASMRASRATLQAGPSGAVPRSAGAGGAARVTGIAGDTGGAG